MKKIRRVLLLFIIVAYASMIFACKGNVEEKEGKTSIEELDTSHTDVEATESETTSGDKESEKESQSKEEITTVVDTKNQETSASKEEVTTSKKEDSTTNKETTTKKQQQTTTKKQQQTTTKKQQQQTTTKKQQQQTTTKQQQQTTTKKQEANKEEATTEAIFSGNSATTGNTRGGAITVTEFTESDTAKAKAKAIVGQIVKSSMSDYECVKAIHDYLIKNVNYDVKSIENGSIDENNHPSHTAEGALCNNLAVCDGYAKAFELMCAEAGIYAYMMYGEGINPNGGREEHAWNVVKVNGAWYQVDCTWDDPIVNSQVVTDGSNITYMYFLLTDSEMYKDHTLDNEYSKNKQVCTSTLFKGLAQKLSIEAQMQYSGCIVADVNSFYIKNSDFTSKSQFSYSIAITVAESNKIDGQKWQDAIVEGVRASGFTGGFSYEYSSMQTGDYIVYNIVIKK